MDASSTLTADTFPDVLSRMMSWTKPSMAICDLAVGVGFLLSHRFVLGMNTFSGDGIDVCAKEMYCAREKEKVCILLSAFETGPAMKTYGCRIDTFVDSASTTI